MKPEPAPLTDEQWDALADAAPTLAYEIYMSTEGRLNPVAPACADGRPIDPC